MTSNILAVLLGITATFVITGNIGVIASVLMKPTLAKRISIRFIMSLSLADLMVGTVMALSLVYDIIGVKWNGGVTLCKILNGIDILGTTSSLLHIYVLTWDSYWAITSPLTYMLNMNSKRASKVIGYVWFLSGVFVVLWWLISLPGPSDDSCTFFNKTEGFVMLSSVCSFYGPLMLMIYVSFRVYKIAVKNSLRGSGRSNAVTVTVDRRGSMKVQVVWTKILETEQQMKSKVPGRKAMVRLTLIVGVFILCWLPFFAIYAIIEICETCISDAETLKSIFAWLAWLNSGLNPIIYACSKSDFQKALYERIRKFRKKRKCANGPTPVAAV